MVRQTSSQGAVAIYLRSPLYDLPIPLSTRLHAKFRARRCRGQKRMVGSRVNLGMRESGVIPGGLEADQVSNRCKR